MKKFEVDFEELLPYSWDCIPVPDDKLDECQFFMSQMESTTEASKMRWLLSAYLNACYSFFEIKVNYSYFNPNFPKDEFSLAELSNFIDHKANPTKNIPKKTQTFGKDERVKLLYELRHENTHNSPMLVLTKNNEDFYIKYNDENIYVLEFCNEIHLIMEKIYKRCT